MSFACVRAFGGSRHTQADPHCSTYSLYTHRGHGHHRVDYIPSRQTRAKLSRCERHQETSRDRDAQSNHANKARKGKEWDARQGPSFGQTKPNLHQRNVAGVSCCHGVVVVAPTTVNHFERAWPVLSSILNAATSTTTMTTLCKVNNIGILTLLCIHSRCRNTLSLF